MFVYEKTETTPRPDLQGRFGSQDDTDRRMLKTAGRSRPQDAQDRRTLMATRSPKTAERRRDDENVQIHSTAPTPVATTKPRSKSSASYL
ncbi:hypothetical protein PybrP1_003183, partial [[Pythium] brassicae (nom. inval.)]